MLPYVEFKDKLVVVIDIFRASSAISAAINYGVEQIIPVKTIEEALDYKEQGYITAAERKGEIVEGFDFGNSPFSFMREELKGKTVVLTTTNCTTAIHEARDAYKIIIGSFVNFSAVVNYLKEENKNILLLCAGWKNNFNLEDTVFAGALVDALQNQFTTDCDSATAALHLFNLSKNNLRSFLKNSSHARRLHHLGIDEDIDFCLTYNQCTEIPVYNGKAIEKHNRVVVNEKA